MGNKQEELKICAWSHVLDSSRTGLIFSRIQEGAQPGGLTQPQPGQTEQGIPYHVPACWVPVGEGAAQRELSGGSGACSGGVVWESGSVVQSVLSCFLLISIVVVTVPFVCCSVKLPLSQPPGFCLFFFPFSSAPRQGERRPRGAFVAGGSRNQNILIGAQAWSGDNGRADQRVLKQFS